MKVLTDRAAKQGGAASFCPPVARNIIPGITAEHEYKSDRCLLQESSTTEGAGTSKEK
jgi:hypothetical protein